ncbi:MAG: mevalonate kinase [Deltaproteobacteria bacterium]|nr:mevalonate kinase [Myxococcales bacterium]MDP3220650.1 mevalonate kinase [Deltaproteobacteria bacterium]
MTASAHGKVILLGEHAVVFGADALAASLSPGAECEARPSPGGPVLEVSPWGSSFRPDDGSELGRAVGGLCAAMGVDGVTLALTLHLPGGGGLGSSAAMGVACARALAEMTGRPLDDDALLGHALAWERVFHGNPSGVDHTLAALGGVGLYNRASGFRRVPTRGALRLCLGDSGERASTRSMVEGVARLRERRPEATDRTFEAIGVVARNGALALETGDAKGLGDFMNLNQNLLSTLLVSTERLEDLCAAARDAGALGAKLTGAGGGGCVIALAPGREDAVLARWATLGVDGRVVEVGR